MAENAQQMLRDKNMNENKKWATYHFIMIPKNNQKSSYLLYEVNWQNLKKQTRNSNITSEITAL